MMSNHNTSDYNMSNHKSSPVHVSQRVGQPHNEAVHRTLPGPGEVSLPQTDREASVLLHPAVPKDCHQVRTEPTASKWQLNQVLNPEITIPVGDPLFR